MKRLVDVDIILKATAGTEQDKALMQNLSKFYNRHFPRIGVDLYWEKTLDGMLMFYSTFEDFFSSFYIPNQCSGHAHTQDNYVQVQAKGTPIRWRIHAEKLPAGHSFPDLMRTAQKFYEKFIPGTVINVNNDREAEFVFPNQKSFECGLHFIQNCIGSTDAVLPAQ